MTSLLELRQGPRAWEADALPYVYEEAGRTQFAGMPGVSWVRDTSSPNGRGFYRGPREAIEIVATTLESAGVCKVRHALGGAPSALTPASGSILRLLDERLRPYQLDGAAWCASMLRREGACLLADDMGLGKTPTAIAALEAALPAGASVRVVCPAVVVGHWEKEIEKWRSRPDILWAGPLSYEKWTSYQAKGELTGANALVVDECHYVSNPGSKRSKAVAAWCAAHPNAARLLLSGTPMTASPTDLWHPLNIMHPGRWGKHFAFQKRYCDGHFEELTAGDGRRVTDANGDPLKPVWVAKGVSRAGELHVRLTRVMLRRTKAQVGGEIPPKTRVIHEITLAASARKRLKQAGAALVGKGELEALLRETEPFKLGHVEALARDCIAVGGRPLILTLRRESAEALGEALACPWVHGDVPPDKRTEILATGQAGVATLFSVTTGVNLTQFDVVIFAGLDWLPSRILQGEDRAHRIGQTRPVTVYYVIARGTVDEIIRGRVLERLDTFAAVVGDSADAGGLSASLAGGNEDDLIAAIVAAAKEASR